jgi:hypothetical protein
MLFVIVSAFASCPLQLEQDWQPHLSLHEWYMLELCVNTTMSSNSIRPTGFDNDAILFEAINTLTDSGR